jgi:hypothetical protein
VYRRKGRKWNREIDRCREREREEREREGARERRKE